MDREGFIRFAAADPDYTKRPEPTEILAGSFLSRRYVVLMVLGLALIALVTWAFHRLRLTIRLD